MKNTEIYLLKYRTNDYPYYKICRGNFKKAESVMEKTIELRSDSSVESIVVKKRTERKTTNFYKWENGFEVIYLNN